MTNRELINLLLPLKPDALAVVAVSSDGDNIRMYAIDSVTDEWYCKEVSDTAAICIDDCKPEVKP